MRVRYGIAVLVGALLAVPVGAAGDSKPAAEPSLPPCRYCHRALLLPHAPSGRAQILPAPDRHGSPLVCQALPVP